MTLHLDRCDGYEWRMMRDVEVEGWARSVIDRVEQGTANEDSRIEFKADWPVDPNKAARRIAGHCNASNGQPALWLIGVDKTAGAVGVSPSELANWGPGVLSWFEGDVPRMRELAFLVDGKQVVALLFDTDRAPFVVRNAVYGQPEGGPVSREVPWRDGTAVRSATRADLLRLLLPGVRIPTLDVLDGTAELRLAKGRYILTVTLKVYAVLPMGSAIVLPDHQARGSLRLQDSGFHHDLDVTLTAHTWSHPGVSQTGTKDFRTHTVDSGDGQILVHGPGFFRIIGKATFDDSGFSNSEPLEAIFTLRPAGADIAASARAALVPGRRISGGHPPIIAGWMIENSDSAT